MDYWTIIATITKAAKAVHVSAALLIAICSHESLDFTKTYNKIDGGSPSYGVCQAKYSTAKWMGFKGRVEDLMKPDVNAKWAATYLAYQMKRYGDDWCKLAAAYNAGTYNESKKLPGKPRNLRYVRHVQKRLAEDLQNRLSCELAAE